MVDALGGGAKIGDDGNITGPSYTLTNGENGKQPYTKVGDALSALDSAITKAKGELAR